MKLSDGTKELYSFDIPITSARNLIIGKPYVDVHGKTQVINHTNSEMCELHFKEKGWNSSNAQAVVGVVKTASGKPFYKLRARWNANVVITNLET